MRSIIRRASAGAFVVVAVVAVVASMATTSSAAGRVQRYDVTVDRHRVSSALCGFPLAVHMTGPLSFTDRYSKDGDLVVEIERFHQFHFTWTNPATGATLTGESSGIHRYHDIEFHEDGSISYTTDTNGSIRRVHVPGAGEITGVFGHVVDHVVEYPDGTISDDIVFETPKAADQNLEPFCDYLSA